MACIGVGGLGQWPSNVVAETTLIGLPPIITIQLFTLNPPPTYFQKSPSSMTADNLPSPRGSGDCHAGA
uniref:Uncharacterized protein n=1 Tax=Setaria italica TaxID=4555 RepID=K3YXF5_SETIT